MNKKDQYKIFFRFILILIFWIVTGGAKKVFAENSALKGSVLDSTGAALPYVTITLLHPADSTLAYFAVSTMQGSFELNNVTSGDYILQVACVGFSSIYRKVHFPVEENGKDPVFILRPKPVNLKETEVSAERIPIMLRKDTIEYDAASFKTAPDAATEDLLKKLPGLEVDRNGNIKAQGEEVKNVLVDGKEFFSSDPKIATRNLPADAVKKVQVYDEKSDQAVMTGIEDGERNKTINLQLKDDKKNAWLGEVQAGGGTDDHFQASAKVYRFSGVNQVAVLGMLNTINQFGFSFQDYLDFNGGLGEGGESFHISMGDDDVPLNFGQAINGKIASGGAGFNYSHEARKDRRFSFSYLANGANKSLVQETHTENFLQGSTYVTDESLEEKSRDRAHRFNFGWRNKIDSTRNIRANAKLSVSKGADDYTSFQVNRNDNLTQNSLTGSGSEKSIVLNGSASLAYLKTWKEHWKLFKISIEGTARNMRLETSGESRLVFETPPSAADFRQFRKDATNGYKGSASALITRELGKDWYFESKLKGGGEDEFLDRKEGIEPSQENSIDSLSPEYHRMYTWIQPGITIKRSREKSRIEFFLGETFSRQERGLLGQNLLSTEYYAFLPGFSYEKDLKGGKRLGLAYESSMDSPGLSQLLPITDRSDRLQTQTGNENLAPENRHQVHLNWLNFDQFSFTSLFSNLFFTYTQNKINWSREVKPDLSQSLYLINVPDDYRASFSLEYSRPIRKLGITLHGGIDENWNQGINIVNGVKNIQSNLEHTFSLSFDNRKKEKADIHIGGSVSFRSARYSLQKEINQNYLQWNVFLDMNYSLSPKWQLTAFADLTKYEAKGFQSAQIIPLIKAGLSRKLFKSNRGTLLLEGFDLLNRNTGIERISEMNFLQERRSNTIGRYVLLSFKYRLNKFEKKDNFDIKVNGK